MLGAHNVFVRGRDDLYAGFCYHPQFPVWWRRPSILGQRCRWSHATYPCAQASSLQMRTMRSCSGRGLPSRTSHLARWWALTPPFHPHQANLAVCFLWHCPAGHPGWLLATALLYGARTFLDQRKRCTAAARPSRLAAQVCHSVTPSPHCRSAQLP